MSLNQIIKRCISTTSVNYGKRNFRKFQVLNKRGTRTFKKMQAENPDPDLLHTRGVRPIGYKDSSGKYIVVPEMIPELIVPNLEGCELKPYVSYRTPDVVQSEFTSQDLFNVVYAQKIVNDFKEEKLDDSGNPLEPSDNEKLTAEEAKMKARQTGCDMF